MRKIAALIATVGAIAALAVAGTGTAAPGPGCPTGGGWFEAPVAWAIPDFDTGNYSDNNGDGLGCARVNAGQTSKHPGAPGGAWTWKDNS